MTDRLFATLPDRGKTPSTKRALDTWIQQAQKATDMASRRLGWIVASSIVIAALQRAHHEDGNACFLLKGGAYMEHKLGLRARSTKDIDTLFRGDFDEFLSRLDEVFQEPWGTIQLERTAVDVIDNAKRVVKPRRFSVKLLLRGAVWRSVDVEVAPDEGRAGQEVECLPAPELHHFGLPSPSAFTGIVLDYQVAQKLHACTDPHDPPFHLNERARDVVDLILIRDAFYPPEADLSVLHAACLHIFKTRADDATRLGNIPIRAWPPTVVAHAPWEASFPIHAEQVGMTMGLGEAVEELNHWIERIDASVNSLAVRV
ncbi:nucleotidyl transferase AbiEii/AbiGii toxin family protein [Phytoactinopolyspora halotolerans]|uniref:Nucleotidyl transferase AbiEii/AbiGii toxin family protein n=1 Tax=Phytoactinopolyspora halotolerans TaxID=1981512 RepID=A0A6L9S0T7_9ACTN|nr:nucleotidyl transferase AbiEii/AbiGii toxin family protein [Phytoactinopolyspora halotolerans]NED98626.1 nucleotidyl transferase AbiEii/AbiGii toxin family protein [Phytoactinopolyspora halotolerans]